MRRTCVMTIAVLMLSMLTAMPLSTMAVARSQIQPATARPPNVVLIMTDDMGYGDLGSYGATDIRTPNIDSLARDGVMLTDFYANGVLCSPTRAGLISGRYQQRYVIETALGGEGTRGLRVTGRSLPQLLKNNGYATGLIGKWHLGGTPEVSANAHGFDYFFGFLAGYIDFYTHGRGGQHDLWVNDTKVTRDGYMTDLITAESIQFIERNANRPFFVDVAYNAPHWPYQVPDRPSVAVDNARHLMPHDPDTSTRADYVAMVERVDQGVGEILQTLDRLGLANDTIVIFTNDNGGEWLANNRPLFHRKWTVWEGGIRVPTLIRWPGRIPAGQVSDQVGITMDITASILAATRTPVPADARFEGIDLFPILEGRAPEMERTLFWRTTQGGNLNQRAVRSGDWKLIVDGGHVMLFNLRHDVGERNDLANRRQDIAQRLRPLITAWERDVDAEAAVNDPEAAAAFAGRGRGAGPAGRGGAPGGPAGRGDAAAPAGQGTAPAGSGNER
jgi:arylsulfatase A